jgi:hypothetical protein
MPAPLPWHCATFTHNVGTELFQAAIIGHRAQSLRKQNAARCWPKQTAVVTSAVEPSMPMIGKADHVLARSTGGKHAVDNYLAAHSICNNYRWHYDAEEFQWILKLGVWMRTQIEKGTPLGLVAGQKFCRHERRRSGRRKLNVPVAS